MVYTEGQVECDDCGEWYDADSLYEFCGRPYCAGCRAGWEDAEEWP